MSPPRVPNWTRRLAALDQACSDRGVPALVVSSPVNLRYLTGFTGSSGLLISGVPAIFITDGRYEASVRDRISEGALAAVEVRPVQTRYDVTLAECLKERAIRRAGFEAGHVTVQGLHRWQTYVSGVEWVPTESLVERQRLIKDDEEVACFRRGGRLLSDVARGLKDWLAQGRSELDVARDIDRAIERAGFERQAFETIVAAGPHSAYPHARPTDRRLQRGDLVVLDFGGVLDGYCVDLTRVAGIGQIESAAESLYTAVRAAQSAALGAVRAGVRGSAVDAAARNVLEARGLGHAFLHGTGHGLGLEVHEAPRLARVDTDAPDVLEAGMTCTIEPGAYLQGVGGVRLEDDVLVTAAGSEELTDAPRDLIRV
jgi:Xaa-Pro aminopeptidase